MSLVDLNKIDTDNLPKEFCFGCGGECLCKHTLRAIVEELYAGRRVVAVARACHRHKMFLFDQMREALDNWSDATGTTDEAAEQVGTAVPRWSDELKAALDCVDAIRGRNYSECAKAVAAYDALVNGKADEE